MHTTHVNILNTNTKYNQEKLSRSRRTERVSRNVGPRRTQMSFPFHETTEYIFQSMGIQIEAEIISNRRALLRAKDTFVLKIKN